jgi:hypothetical protein
LSPIRPAISSRTTRFARPVLGLVVAAGLAGSISAISASESARPAATSGHAGLASAQGIAAGQRPAVLDAVTAVAANTASAHHRRGKARHLTSKQIARQMFWRFGWRQWQFKYLNLLWMTESSWNVYAANPYTGAYGIPQADPGEKMSSAGPNWEGNARTQIRWGLRYIKSQYGTPWRAWQHELADGWY